MKTPLYIIAFLLLAIAGFSFLTWRNSKKAADQQKANARLAQIISNVSDDVKQATADTATTAQDNKSISAEELADLIAKYMNKDDRKIEITY